MALIGNMKGPKGENGAQGTPGTNGFSFRAGTTNPANTLGVDGDTYLNVTTGDVFTKVSGSWT